MINITGKVWVDDDELGTFIMDSDEQIILELNGGRWTAPFVFEWARKNGRSVRFEPCDIPTGAAE